MEKENANYIKLLNQARTGDRKICQDYLRHAYIEAGMATGENAANLLIDEVKRNAQNRLDEISPLPSREIG